MESKSKRVVVTGGNKGIGFEICRRLADEVVVILTARDEERGVDAVTKLHSSGLTEINNAGIVSTPNLDKEWFKGQNLPSEKNEENVKKSKEVAKQTFEGVQKCLETNYYGVKHVTRALLTLLLKSSSPRIVNISSRFGQLKNVQDESTRKILSDLDGLTEELVDGVVSGYLEDAKDPKLLEKKGWSSDVSGYIISKATLNAYTRILAKKYPSICANVVSPGFVATDITLFQGTSTVEEGARGPVRVALMPDVGPSGRYFSMIEESTF
ncbi:hypothetical protein L6452_16208 [Arctium lappa]|uniref:Uncharacterized protein n=1 Tax=Arctium lappa TaxID=4217 RepID=A0ACB9BZV8_ARCLA|nr:hypothetical protein L6452_16208 [Arctium lappa]